MGRNDKKRFRKKFYRINNNCWYLKFYFGGILIMGGWESEYKIRKSS